MSKLWIGKKLYSVENEVRDYCEKLEERIEELKADNAKLNIILYHRENGLSHPDFKAEIEISKQAERIKNFETENKTLKDMLRKEGYEFTDFSEIKTLNS